MLNVSLKPQRNMPCWQWSAGVVMWFVQTDSVKELQRSESSAPGFPPRYSFKCFSFVAVFVNL